MLSPFMTIIKLMSYEAFNSASRYLEDLLNNDNLYIKQMVGQIYPTKLLLIRRIPLILEPPPLLDLDLSITNETI